MKHLNCIGCKNKIKKGEFVVLNGGAMVKTKTGAMLGDKTLLGFLTVQNHFDSKRNYQSLMIAHQCEGGQFEFYACSHKCLADFLHKQVMHMTKISKFKSFELAPQSKLDKIGYNWGLRVTNSLGVKGALITDESIILDFIDSQACTDPAMDSRLQKAIKKLGFKINYSDPIWKVAKKLKRKVQNEQG